MGIKKIILGIVLVFPLITRAQSNYVKTTIYTSEYLTYHDEQGLIKEDDKIETVRYYDGLGRPIQLVNQRAGGEGEDIISHIEYDELGRKEKEYLPYPENINSGLYRDNILLKIQDFYNTEKYENTINPYSQKIFEASPLSRVLEQAAPGNDWSLSNNHTIKFNNKLNALREVRRYNVLYLNGDTNQPKLVSSTGFYNKNQLSKIIIKDENWKEGDGVNHTTEEFKDKLGRVVLKRAYNDSTPHDTYYIYDDFGNLTFVLPPKIDHTTFLTEMDRGSYNDYFNIAYSNDFSMPTSGDPDGGGTVGVEIKNGRFLTIKYQGDFPVHKSLDGQGNEYIYKATYLPTKSVIKVTTNPKLSNMIFGSFVIQNEGGHNITIELSYKDGFLHQSVSAHQYVDKFQGSVGLDLTTIENPYLWLVDQVQLDNLCYQYKYDSKNRLVEKKIPGKGWEYIIYNKLDQPILMQDAIQRLESTKEWLFTKYDVFGRVAYTGTYQYNDDRKSLQALVDGQNQLYETRTDTTIEGETINWSNIAFPQVVHKLYSVNYYDDYAYNFAEVEVPDASFGNIVTGIKTKNLVTGSMLRVLDLPTKKWIKTTRYYNDKGRVIYVKSNNEYLETEDILESNYNFVGNVLKTRSSHKKGTNPIIVTLDTYRYDHMSRLISQNQCIGDETLKNVCGVGQHPSTLTLDADDVITESTIETAYKSITLAPGFHIVASSLITFEAKIVEEEKDKVGELIVNNNYDGLGLLKSKNIGNTVSTPLQTVDYKYNIRGWLKQINNPTALGDDLFGFKIGYNEGSNALYNGNVSSTEWKTQSENTTDNPVSVMYNYTYDALNRIKTAIDNTGNYNLTGISYDLNGNIETLQRTTVGGTMDNLVYDYGTENANKLYKVTDGITASIGQEGFKDGNKTGDDYVYDANGNMTIDKNKGITGITYNHLNLPIQVTINKGVHNGTINYVYDATGVKLKKIVSTGVTTSYAGNYIYEKPKEGVEILKFFNHSEGYIEPTVTGEFKYVYQYKDHLGNIRLSYSDNDGSGYINAENEIIEENNYYPFGLKHKGYNNVVNGTSHPYKFGGKELSEELGLNTYDFGARNYDASLGRWMNPDPLADFAPELTPYRYAANNPIFFNDPNGLWEFVTNEDDDGNITLSLNKTSEDDDWKSLRKETGLSNSQLKKAFGKDFKNSLNVVEFGGDGIASSDIGGEVGETINGIEEGLNELNSALKELNASGAGAVNNCWGACTSISSNNRVDPNGLIGAGFLFDGELQSNFNNVSSARFGDVIRYAQGDDATNTAQHGSMFLLKNDKGSQIFTKNGASNAALYQVMYENEMLKTYSGTGGFANYGQARGMTRTETQTTTVPGSDQTTTNTVNVNDKPYYRPKN